MTVELRVPWIRAGGTYRDVTANPKWQNSVSLGTVVHTGLSPVSDPASGGSVRLVCSMLPRHRTPAASTLPCRRQHTSVPPQRLSSIWTCRRLFI
jgi:hypothetical protein